MCYILSDQLPLAKLMLASDTFLQQCNDYLSEENWEMAKVRRKLYVYATSVSTHLPFAKVKGMKQASVLAQSYTPPGSQGPD